MKNKKSQKYNFLHKYYNFEDIHYKSDFYYNIYLDIHQDTDPKKTKKNKFKNSEKKKNFYFKFFI
jgi:hypothetical protein